MNSEIKLNSRGGVNNKLIRIGEEDSMKFKLKTQYNYRIGFNDNGDTRKIAFIDPAGGPFITVGSKIDGHIVKAIYEEGIIEFES